MAVDSQKVNLQQDNMSMFTARDDCKEDKSGAAVCAAVRRFLLNAAKDGVSCVHLDLRTVEWTTATFFAVLDEARAAVDQHKFHLTSAVFSDMMKWMTKPTVPTVLSMLPIPSFEHITELPPTPNSSPGSQETEEECKKPPALSSDAASHKRKVDDTTRLSLERPRKVNSRNKSFSEARKQEAGSLVGKANEPTIDKSGK